MFGGRFSLNRFSLPAQTETEIKITAFYMENVRSLVSFGANTPVRQDFREIAHGDILGARGVRIANQYVENVRCNATARANLPITNVFFESISSQVYLASDFALGAQFNEDVSTKIHLGIDTPIRNEYREAVRSSVLLGKDVYGEIHIRESVFARIYSAILEKDTLIIDVNIPPGSELRINSEDFTVLLDGANIIHLHNGDWINVSRDLVDIAISSNGSKMLGSILYTERFL